jgi:hypothetical protein
LEEKIIAAINANNDFRVVTLKNNLPDGNDKVNKFF